MLAGQRGNALVLCYHALSETWPAALSVTPGHFRSQITRLLQRGYRPVTFADAAQAEPDPTLLAITFDDAYRSVFEVAAPILAELDVPATLFAPSAYMGTERPMSWPGIDRWLGTEHEPELMPMSWSQLDELAAAGWEIGSHTVTHPHLTRVDDATLRRELGESRVVCEDRLGRPCPSIAYPYGDVDARVMSAAADAGYRFGAGLPGVMGKRHALDWARVGVYRADPSWRFTLKVSRPLLQLRDSSPLGPLVNTALRRRSRRRDTGSRP
jgi:peptidoglycan/xylan/chitin deacetylase (PgdA/CDA1 family)